MYAISGNNNFLKGFTFIICVALLNILIACGGSSSTEPDSPDTIPPIITLNGDSEVNLVLGENYVEQGASATDNQDANVTVTISGSVDSSITGTYTVTYSASDSAGNASSIIRIVHVVQAPDTTPPVITLNGDSEITLVQGEAYTELGATAADDRDGELAVTIDGTVDTSVVDVYTITYTASDQASNSSEVTRTVNVIPASTSSIYDLAGTTWQSGCNLIENGHPETEEDTYQQSVQQFNEAGTTIDTNVNIYEPQNSSCSGQASYVMSSIYNMEFGELIITNSGLEAYQIDFDLVYESVPNTWSPFVLDIIYRNNSNLYYGVETEDEQTRPTTLDFNYYFTLVED